MNQPIRRPARTLMGPDRSAYRRPRARVQLRSPIAQHLADVDQITPSRHAVRRDAHRHSAPSPRLDVHRPKCLGSVSCARRSTGSDDAFWPSARAPTPCPYAAFRRPGARSASAQISPCRGDVRGSICVAKAALAPGFDVDRPPTPERLAPVTFRPRRRSSNMRRSPIWTARAHLRNRAETGRLRLHVSVRRRHVDQGLT